MSQTGNFCKENYPFTFISQHTLLPYCKHFIPTRLQERFAIFSAIKCANDFGGGCCILTIGFVMEGSSRLSRGVSSILILSSRQILPLFFITLKGYGVYQKLSLFFLGNQRKFFMASSLCHSLVLTCFIASFLNLCLSIIN